MAVVVFGCGYWDSVITWSKLVLFFPKIDPVKDSSSISFVDGTDCKENECSPTSKLHVAHM